MSELQENIVYVGDFFNRAVTADSLCIEWKWNKKIRGFTLGSEFFCCSKWIDMLIAMTKIFLDLTIKNVFDKVTVK